MTPAIQNPHTSVMMLMAQNNFEQAQGSLIIKVSEKSGEYKILSLEHTHKVLPPLENLDAQLEDLIFHLTGDDDTVLGAGILPKPNTVKSVLAYENALFEQACKEQWEEDVYFLRYPYDQAMTFLKLFEQQQSNSGEVHLKAVAIYPLDMVDGL